MRADKYGFKNFHVGETTVFPLVYKNIRSAATMYGTRYGVWFNVEKRPDGFYVTRIEAPPSNKSKRKEALDIRLKRIEDGVRFCSIILVKLQKEKANETDVS